MRPIQDVTEINPTPREVANQAERWVVGLPLQAMTCLLHLSLGQAGNDLVNVGASQISDHLDKLKATEQYLNQSFSADFKSSAGPLSDPLSKARAALSSNLSDFLRAMSKSLDGCDPKTVLDLSERVQERLSKSVGAFLGALFDQVVDFEKSSAKRAQDVDSGGLAEIAQISRKINFIAVNASVEAARVGDAGRGFAVIANEIKDLSQQSKNAVDRITDQIA